jgi:hypothetical protein
MAFAGSTSCFAQGQEYAWPVMSEPARVSIFAGHSRLDVTPDGSIKIDAQMRAFKAALIHADAVRHQTGVLPRVSIAFSHRGAFRRQFVRVGLGSHPHPLRLCHLRTEIITTFASVADALHIPLEHILVIHEDAARTHAELAVNTSTLPAVVASEYFCSAMGEDASEPDHTVLEVFFEPSPWSEVPTYVRGLKLTHALGKAFGIRLNLVTPEGAVRHGEIAYGVLASPELIA